MRSLLVFSLFCFLLLVACRDESVKVPAAEKVVKIGVLAPLSGPAEKMGMNGVLGIKTALAVQPSLITGARLDLVVEDDGNDPLLSRKKFSKLVREDGVAAVLMLSGSNVVLEALQDADLLHVPVIVVNATHPAVTDSRWVVQMSFDDRIQATVAAIYLRDELFLDHAAVFIDRNSSHGNMLARKFIKKFESSGGRVEQITFSERPKDLVAVLNQLDNEHVDTLYLPVNADLLLEVEKKLQKLEWKPQVMISDGILSILRLKHAHEIDFMNGILATDVYSATMQESKYGEKVHSLYRSLTKDYQQPGTTFAGLACEGTSLLLAVMDECGSTGSERACIQEKLRSGKEFDGLAGKILLQTDGKSERPIFINTIEKGKIHHVVKIF